jgi:phytoene synthase
MTPDEYCQDKAARAGSGLYYALLFAPPAQRRAATALYALRRELEHSVREGADPAVARGKLDWWKQEIARMQAGAPTHPVTQALAPHLAPHGMDSSTLLALTDAMEMDLTQTRYLDWPALRRYCELSGGALGEAAARLFGPVQADVLLYAGKLGMALQLIRLIREAGQDARHGRIYLPMDELQAFGVTAADILNARHSPAFEALMTFQAQRARQMHREALHALPASSRRVQRPGLALAAMHMTLLNEIERDRWQVLSQRISLTPLRKLWIAWRTWVRGGR